MNDELTYKPSAYYFRTALHAAATVDEAVAIGLHLVAELEQLKLWIRERGHIPPKWNLMQTEIDQKRWGEMVPWPSSE